MSRHLARRLVLAATAVASLAGCTIRADATPRDVDPDDRSLLVTEAADPSASTGASRIYLLSSNEPNQQRQLRSVQRDVPSRPDPLLRSLLSGPTQDELDARIATALPSGTELLSTRSAGDVLFVDLSGEINDLTGDALVAAVAQVVFTASEIDGIQAVRLRVEGVEQAWPRGDGQTATGALTVYDFPGLVQSAQPAYPAVPSGG